MQIASGGSGKDKNKPEEVGGRVSDNADDISPAAPPHLISNKHL